MAETVSDFMVQRLYEWVQIDIDGRMLSIRYPMEVSLAAAEVLDAAGFFVRMPERPLCCGRPAV